MTPPIDGPAAQRLAQEELARPEYHQGGPSWIDRIIAAVERFLSHLFGGGGGGSSTALLVVGALILAVVVFALVRAGRWPGRRHHGVGADDPLAPEAGVDHAARAEALARTGALAEAVREFLRDVVATLERAGIVDRRPGRTGAAAAAAGARALPDAAPTLTAAATAFDDVWFGGRPATPADVELARDAADVVRRTATTGAR